MFYKTLQQQVQPRMLSIFLLSLIVMTLLCGFLYVLKKPLKQMGQSKQALQLLEREVRTGVPLENQIATFQQQIEQLNEKLHGTDLQLPVNQMIAFLIGQLDEIAEQQQVKLISIKPATVKPLLSFRELPFHIELQGNYFNLFNWLDAVNRQLGPIVIKKFEFTAGAKTSNRSLRLVLASYQYIEQ